MRHSADRPLAPTNRKNRALRVLFTRPPPPGRGARQPHTVAGPHEKRAARPWMGLEQLTGTVAAARSDVAERTVTRTLAQ